MKDWGKYFRYDQNTGKLHWKLSKSKSRVPEGSEAGYLDKSSGYVCVTLDGKIYRAHRIIWEMFNGPIPEGMQIDHVNHIRCDNRLVNLGLVTHKENGRNVSRQKNNTSGITGVHWDKNRSKWHAQIKYKGKIYGLGRFDDFFEACCARKSKELEFKFHPNHGRNTEGVEK